MCEIITKHRLTTEFPACSVEWCRECPEIFSVGLYHLDKQDELVSANNLREGRIEIFNLDSSNQLEKLQSVETDAVLDQKWMKNKLFTATSAGSIECYDLNCEGTKNLVKISEIKLQKEVSDCLALSLDVKKDHRLIAASDSKGKISVLDIEENLVRQQFDAHQFEAWTVAFDNFSDEIIYSGGDDGFLKIWDTRENQASQTKSLRRDAGVTSLYQRDENLLFVGSYDENLCCYDLRKLKVAQSELNLGGGIWRIKPAPTSANLFIVACMYHNFSIVEFENSNYNLVAGYNEHESICYGCDWSSNSLTFAACSFYDKKLSVCEVKI